MGVPVPIQARIPISRARDSMDLVQTSHRLSLAEVESNQYSIAEVDLGWFFLLRFFDNSSRHNDSNSPQILAMLQRTQDVAIQNSQWIGVHHRLSLVSDFSNSIRWTESVELIWSSFPFWLPSEQELEIIEFCETISEVDTYPTSQVRE
jgi:hypothetical protein